MRPVARSGAAWGKEEQYTDEAGDLVSKFIVMSYELGVRLADACAALAPRSKRPVSGWRRLLRLDQESAYRGILSAHQRKSGDARLRWEAAAGECE